MANTTQPKTVVVTVVLAEGHFSHTVTVDGRNVEDVALGLVLTGPLSLAVANGAEKAITAIQLATQAGRLAESLTAGVLNTLVQATEQVQAQLKDQQESATENTDS